MHQGMFVPAEEQGDPRHQHRHGARGAHGLDVLWGGVLEMVAGQSSQFGRLKTSALVRQLLDVGAQVESQQLGLQEQSSQVRHGEHVFFAEDVDPVRQAAKARQVFDDLLQVGLPVLALRNRVCAEVGEGDRHPERVAQFFADRQHFHFGMEVEAVAGLDLERRGAERHHAPHALPGGVEQCLFRGLARGLHGAQNAPALFEDFHVGDAAHAVDHFVLALAGVNEMRVAVDETRHHRPALAVHHLGVASRGFDFGVLQDFKHPPVLDQQGAVFSEADARLGGGAGLHQLADVAETENAAHVVPYL